MSSSSSAAAPKHILIAVRELGIGGSERQACLLARLLDPRLFRVTVGCFVSQGLRRAELDAAGVPVVEFPIRSFKDWKLPLLARQVRQWIDREKVALVHSFDYPTALFFAPLLALGRSAPVITSLRSFRPLVPQPYRFLLQQAERMSALIVVNSAEVRNDLVCREGLPGARLRLLYNAVDTAEFPAPECSGARPRPPELSGASIVVGCVCALRPEKDLPTLMRAVRALRGDFPGLRLVIVGSGPAEAEMKSVCCELGIEDITVLVPQTSRPQPWLAAIDVFVLPSITEAVSNALLEAMSSECAVVASRVGGNPEIIDSGENGLLFPAKDVAALT